MTMPGSLTWSPALEAPALLGPTVLAALRDLPAADQVMVAEIDPALSDTAEFCARYDVALDVSANCVVVTGKREGQARTAACMVLATTRADVNGVVRRRLDVRKASFMSTADAVASTAMEYGGITPVGLPPDWPVLVDAAVRDAGIVVIGSGIRAAKLAVPGSWLAELPHAEVVDGLAG